MAGLVFSNMSSGINSVLGGRAKRLVPLIAECLLVAVLGVLLMLIVLKLLAPLPTPKGDLMAMVGTSTQDAPPLIAKSPFPKAEIALAPVAETVPDLAETSLDLKLTGVWPGDAISSAIIQVPGGQQKRFVVGDEIVNGVSLDAVYTDQVVLSQNGVRESLRFESKAFVENRVAPSSVPSVPKAGITNIVRLGPGVDAAGKPALALYASNDRQSFERAGLRDGDILTSINGIAPSTDTNQLANLLEQFSNASAVQLVVERDGQRLPITINLSSSAPQPGTE